MTPDTTPDQRALLQPSLHCAALGQHTKLPLGVLIQFNRLGNPHCSNLLERLSMPTNISSITSRALH